MCMADGLVNAHRGCFGGRPSVGTWNGDVVPRSPFRERSLLRDSPEILFVYSVEIHVMRFAT